MTEITNEMVRKEYERKIPGGDDPQFILRFTGDRVGYWRCSKGY